MKNKNQKNNRGVITVLVSLLLAGILSLGTMVIEAGRLQGAKTQLDDANLSAGTSMIASYNSKLYERYGLLSIDNALFNEGRYLDYLEFNSDRAAGFSGNNISTFYTVDTVELEGLYNLTYPSVLKRQLTSRAKLNIIPQDYSLNYYNMSYYISDYQSRLNYLTSILTAVASGMANQGSINDLSSEMISALNVLYEVFSKVKRYEEDYNVTIKQSDMALLPSSTGTVLHQVHEEDIEAINSAVADANTVLGSNGSLLASNVGSVYNEVDVYLNTSFATNAINSFADLNKLAENSQAIASECLKLLNELNAALNVLNAEKENNLLLNSYVAGYFSNKNFSIEEYCGIEKGSAVSEINNANFSGACVEYVFSGDSSEKINQQNSYAYVIATRLVNNLFSVITNSATFDANNSCSVAAHIAWAYYETCADTELLSKYNAVVPESKSNMIFSVNNPEAVSTAFVNKDFLKGMKALGIYKEETFVVEGYDSTNYRDALAWALWFVPNSKKMLRVADLIQLEMRYIEQHVEKGNATFLMSEQNTFCRVKCSGRLNSILPVLSLGDTEGVNGTLIQSVKYIGY